MQTRPPSTRALVAAAAGILFVPLAIYFAGSNAGGHDASRRSVKPATLTPPNPPRQSLPDAAAAAVRPVENPPAGHAASSPEVKQEELAEKTLPVQPEEHSIIENSDVRPGTRRMAQRLAKIARDADPISNLYENKRRAAHYAESIRQAMENPGDNPLQIYSLRFDLAQELLRANQIEEALEQFLQVQKLVETNRNNYPWMLNPSFQAKLHDRLAICYLRIGEQSNCLTRHNAESCIFPIRGAGIHIDTAGSSRAVQEYMKALEIEPENLTYRWLLNLACMTLGQYPDQVAPRWLIPPSALESPYDVGRFYDAAPSTGLDVIGRSGSCIMEDFDGDGNLDIMVSSSGLTDQVRYLRNTGDGSFSDVTEEAGLTGIVGALNICQADYNNDGFPDVFMMRGAWVSDPERDPNSLLRNNGDGTFEDVTEEAGLLSFHPTLTAAWADYDNDGWLDLFVGNEKGRWGNNPMELFHNNKDGTFTECAKPMGLAVMGDIKGSTWGDYNNDGLIDLYLSFIDGPNRLFRNERSRFTDVTKEAGVHGPDSSFPTWFCDYDNDGWLDLFAAGFPRLPTTGQLGDRMLGLVAASYLGIADSLEGIRLDRANKLYRNNRDGTFSDVTVAAKLNVPFMPMGANFGDIDNDGWLDFYIGTGNADLSNLVPNRMMRNAGGAFFQDVTTSGGFGHLQKGHGIAFGDIDNDGDQDIYAVMGGAFEGDLFQRVLFLNPGHGNHWLTLRLEGVRSNRSGLGARICIRVDTPEGERAIHATAGTGGSFGSSSLQQEIGLGLASNLKAIEVYWPSSGIRQIFENVAMDQVFRIREGDKNLEPVELHRIPITLSQDAASSCSHSP